MKPVLFVLLLLIAAPGNAVNESPRTDIEHAARAIYADFMSPYCPGLLLADCRSPAAVELRREIHTQLQAGVPEQKVRAHLEAHFGEKLLAAPHARGLGLLAWVVPFLAVGLGLVGLLLWMQQQRARPASQSPPLDATDPLLRVRLERELSAFDS